jgi:dihydrofolate reductase
MKKAKISLIAAIGKNRELGKDNKLIWRIPEDLKYFHQKTKGHVVIIGRNTFESIGKPLPDRTNIVLSRDLDLKISDCIVADSLEKALEVAFEREKEEIFIIGGAKVYTDSLAVADKLYLTIFDASSEADVYFPEHPNFKVAKESEEFSFKNIKYRFTELIKK